MARIYEDPLKTSSNRLPQRCYYIPQGAAEYQLLSGTWQFAFFPQDVDIPKEVTSWDTIPVPSCWELFGYEAPNYTNINYPHPCDPPYVPDANPCGVYQRLFQLDKLWGKVYFVLEGVSSCAFLTVNGRYVGFTQGSHLQAEFDITDFVRQGENSVRIYVLKWCCGSYLEDQDFFRFHGIFRDCYLLQRPQGHLVDISVKTQENQVLVACGQEADMTLYDREGILVASARGQEAALTVPNLILWNAEHPYLYTLKLERAGEVITQKVGFRTIAVSSCQELLVNGQSVKLRGVNHHDTHPEKGWCQSREDLVQDLRLMKELNINCIRTSHYPPAPEMLELCDEMGFYVILETDIETHGFLRRRANVGYEFDVESPEWPCTDPAWLPEHLERMARAVERDKNHPSILMWSTGNESGYGPNHEKMLRYLASLRDGRLRHCEDACRKGDVAQVDVISRMYLSPAELTELAEHPPRNLPIFLCEYAHAMGNGPGDVWDYNQLFDRHPNLIGGCIWEWADHTVMVEGVAKYGGDFPGELTQDENFCCDGMVFANRSLKAGSLEVKAAYQPMKTRYENGVLTITNRYDFTNLDCCQLRLTIEADGEILSQTTQVLSLAPHETAKLPVSLPEISCRYGANLTCELLRDGKQVARTQHSLASGAAPAPLSGQVLAEEGEHTLTFSGPGFRYGFSKDFGVFTSLEVGGREQLAAPMALTVWRAPTDNDRNIKLLWGSYNIWQGENFDKLFQKTYACRLENGKLLVDGSLAGVSRQPFFHFRQEIAVDAQGRISLSLTGKVREGAVYLPRLGYELSLPGEQPFRYYGRGPWESYPDACHGSTIGLYDSTPAREYVPYIRPQEHGNHVDVRMLSIGNLLVESQAPFCCNVSRFSTQALSQAAHTDELIADCNTHLRLDYQVSGLGSNSCGPELAEKYRLSEKEIAFQLLFTPVTE